MRVQRALSVSIPPYNRTYHYWHAFVPGVSAGQIYGYRVEGPHDPARGMRFDSTKLLLDPYGRGVAVPDCYRRYDATTDVDDFAIAMKSVVLDPSTYDWEGDAPLRHPSARTSPSLPCCRRRCSYSPLGLRPNGSCWSSNGLY